MNRYEGVPCEYCGESFTKDSDVVVCPHCGAPYHRSCYKKLGYCKHKEEHEKGYNWEFPLDKLPPERITICLKCKTPNLKENAYCTNCHAPLSDNVKVLSVIREPADGTNDGTTVGQEVFPGEGKDISTTEAAAYIGSNAGYFLNKFKHIASGGSGITWNWPAFFFKFLYFFYRRMYAVGLLLMIVSAMLTIPSVVYTTEMMKAMSMQYFGVEIAYNAELLNSLSAFVPTINILNIVYTLFCAMFANKLYMKNVFKNIRIIRAKVKEKGNIKTEQYLGVLRSAGKPDRFSVILFVCVFLTLYLKIVTDFAQLLL